MPDERLPPTRARGRIALAAIFGLLALNAWAQVALVPFGRSGDPPTLTLLQALIGLAGAAAAIGSWRGARWAPAAAVAYGLVTAGMLVTLEPLLDLGPESRNGLRIGAVVVLAFALGAGWWLRRAIDRQRGVAAARVPG
jgi:hypothetical protein